MQAKKKKISKRNKEEFAGLQRRAKTKKKKLQKYCRLT